MDRVEKLVKDLVDIALTNNKALAAGSFRMEDVDKLEEAITLNNYVLKTFTNLGGVADAINEKDIIENFGEDSSSVLSEGDKQELSEGVKISRRANLQSGSEDK